MKTIVRCTAFGLLCVVQFPLSAATLIESMAAEGGGQRMWVEGSRMRSEGGEGSEYALVDLETRKMYVVSPEQGQVLDMSGAFQTPLGQGAEPALPDVDVARQGSGPEIAGYETEHYVISAGGGRCGEVFTSKKALADTGMGEMITMMGDLNSAMSMSMDQTSADPCDLADDVVDYREIGLPLKTLGADGQQEELVTRIELGAEVPPGGFDVPSAYPVTDFAQMMQQMMQHMQQQMQP